MKHCKRLSFKQILTIIFIAFLFYSCKSTKDLPYVPLPVENVIHESFKNDNVRVSYKYGSRFDQSIIYQYKDNKLVEISVDWGSIEFIIMNIMIFLAVLLFSALLRYLLENLFFILIN